MSGYRAYTAELARNVPVTAVGFEVETELTLPAHPLGIGSFPADAAADGQQLAAQASPDATKNTATRAKAAAKTAATH